MHSENIKYQVLKILDGFKYFFENGDWLMIRASGTEPVLRTYAESSYKGSSIRYSGSSEENTFELIVLKLYSAQ